MSDTGALLAEMTARLLARICDDATMRAARSGIWQQGAWDAAVELGLPSRWWKANRGSAYRSTKGSR